MDVQIDQLLGQIGNLYYCNEMNRFQLGTVIFEVMEDESDGYRSSMDKLCVIKQDARMSQLLGEVKVVDISKGDDKIYALQDTKDGFNWVEFGTDNADDYYPSFVFRNNVREKEEEKRNREFEEVLKKLKS